MTVGQQSLPPVGVTANDQNEKSDVLLAVQRYYTTYNCFPKKKPGQKVKAYYDATKKLLNDTLDGIVAIDESQSTILLNFLLLLNNAAANHYDQLTIEKYNSNVALGQLEGATHINKKYSSITNAIKRRNCRQSDPRRKRLSRILRWCCWILLLLLAIGFLTGFFLPKIPVQIEESKPFYTEAYDWIRYNIFGAEKPAQPLSLSERYQPYTSLAGMCFLLMVTILLIYKLIITLWCRFRDHKNAQIIKQWNDFQTLKAAFIQAEEEYSIQAGG